MTVPIIKIGNSKGLRLSKAILDHYNINDNVELELHENHIIIKPMKAPRSGWDEAFKEMNNNNDDQLLIDDFFEDEDLDSWK